MRIGLQVISGPNLGAAYIFDRHDTFIVGRGTKAHLQLPSKDKFFSRHHFLLEVNPPLCRLTDLQSSNGTFVNGERVRVRDLQHGDVIVGGDTAIRVEIDDTGGAVDPSREESRPLSLSPTVELSPQRVESAASGIDRLGEYMLLRKLGAGGMGVVYLAEHARTRQRCALKTVAPSGVASETAIQRFLREASILKQLYHPHIVSHLDFGHDGPRVYFAMEYVDGSDAMQLLEREKRLNVARAVDWICQLLKALEYAHARGFVHRDIKPANLLISQRGDGEHLQLADFGLARVYHASALSGLTLEGDVGGSMPYMPPEQITNYRNVDPRGDLYSAAAALYTLLTAGHLYDFPSSPAEMIATILNRDPIPIQTRRPELPPALCQAITRGLAREPADRYKDAAAMRQQLLPFTLSH